eukprot:TRINITY_DN1118_c0_g2_i2.p3 TRINITY_DN1118_c0_g2~~TRINITY_DN1118_c0_g2_i2.p3  ORF type:complete len:246 (-),score=-11.05 TRINITY_DN1118_c0_g2_i2:257-994(-)
MQNCLKRLQTEMFPNSLTEYLCGNRHVGFLTEMDWGQAQSIRYVFCQIWIGEKLQFHLYQLDCLYYQQKSKQNIDEICCFDLLEKIQGYQRISKKDQGYGLVGSRFCVKYPLQKQASSIGKLKFSTWETYCGTFRGFFFNFRKLEEGKFKLCFTFRGLCIKFLLQFGDQQYLQYKINLISSQKQPNPQYFIILFQVWWTLKCLLRIENFKVVTISYIKLKSILGFFNLQNIIINIIIAFIILIRN